MDIHFNSYKMRYHVLDHYLKPVFNSQKIKSVNIFISIDDVFHNLHKPLINNEFQVCGVNANKQLISNVLNLIAHYRQWAVRQNVNCKVYGIYTSSYGNFKNNLYVPQYRKKFIDYMNPLNTTFYFINDAIKNSIELLRVVTQYIQDVYVIDSKYIEPSAIPLYISDKIFPADWNIIISRDTFDLQYSFKDRWSFISPKSDNSKFITRDNIWDYIKEKEKVVGSTNNYDYNLYTIALSIVGDKYRNIPRIKKIGWKTLFKYLDRVNEMCKNMSETTTQILLLNELTNKNVTAEMINNNLMACSIDHQVQNMGEIDMMNIKEQIKDVPDYENLLNINNIYFSKYPLNLVFLTQQYIDYRKAKNPFGI